MPLTPPILEQTAVASGWIPGYELVGLVGAGGHGQVFKARQLALDRVVAVKLVRLDRSAGTSVVARFEREAVALGRFHHPNIVPVFDYGRHQDHLYLAMELLEGEDLGTRIRRTGRVDERTAWQIARQAAAGLAHAAAHGFIHRDVKPANLFLVPAPTGVDLPAGVPMVKLLDFGLAQARAVPADGSQPVPAAIVGTPAYMAPEQHRAADVDLRADIYALGATVYHALVGRPPFAGRTVWELTARKLEQAVTPPPVAMTPESAALIQAMMAPDPEQRIGSYDDLIAAIDRLIDTRRRRIRRTIRAVRVHWPHAATLTAALLALAIALGGARGRRPEPNGPPPVRYASGGQFESLFDGASLDRWASSGAWAVTKDEEGVAVLSGSGLIRRTFPAHPNYRVTLGLDVYEAGAAEVQFAIPAGGVGQRQVLRVSRETGAVAGTRDGDRGPFVPAGEPVPFPAANWFKDRRPYLEVRVERVGETWSVWFGGEPAGRRADDGADKAAEIRVLAVGGRARVDSVVLERLEEVRGGRP